MPAPASDSLRLLLVEDDPGHAHLFLRALRRGGIDYPVVVLGDGEEALAFLTGEPRRAGDLLVLDLHLPRLDGKALLARLREDPRLADLPVIVTTTSLDPADEELCHALGCRVFVEKPIDPVAFEEALARLAEEPRSAE